MREELKSRNLGFNVFAKLAGERWQNLSPADKEPFETQAQQAKEKYKRELADYKKTENYKKYMEYLQDFKRRQANHHQG